MDSSPHTSSRHAGSKAERGSDTQASFRWYESSLVSAGPTCDDADWYPAIKELVQDANFECNEGGIVSKLCLSFFREPPRCDKLSRAEFASYG
jgi:hypothetical protein